MSEQEAKSIFSITIKRAMERIERIEKMPELVLRIVPEYPFSCEFVNGQYEQIKHLPDPEIELRKRLEFATIMGFTMDYAEKMLSVQMIAVPKRYDKISILWWEFGVWGDSVMQ